MRMVPISEAKAKLTELVRVADEEPVYLLRHSKPAGVLLSHERYEQLMEELEDAEDRLALAEHRLHPEPAEPAAEAFARMGLLEHESV